MKNMAPQKPDIQGQNAENSFQNYQKSAAATLEWSGKTQRIKETLCRGKGWRTVCLLGLEPASCIAVIFKPSTAHSGL